jgi:hypothetical protein
LNPDKAKQCLTRLYPVAWQERYGEEFNALLEQSLHTPLDVLDVFLGAVDAHLQLLSGEDLSWRMMDMINKLRTTILMVFTGFIGFVVAGFALVGLADDSPMIPLMQTDTTLRVLWTLIRAGAIVAFLSVVVGGLPLAIMVLRQALKTRQGKAWWLMVPVVSFIALMLYVLVLFLVGRGAIVLPAVTSSVTPTSFPLGNRLLLAGFMLVFVIGAIVSTWATWKLVSGVDVEQETFRYGGKTAIIHIYQFALIPAVVTTCAMMVIFLATIFWGWVSFSSMPGVFFGHYGLWQTSTQATYYGIVLVMLLSTLLALLGLRRNRSVGAAD